MDDAAQIGQPLFTIGFPSKSYYTDTAFQDPARRLPTVEVPRSHGPRPVTDIPFEAATSGGPGHGVQGSQMTLRALSANLSCSRSMRVRVMAQKNKVDPTAAAVPSPALTHIATPAR